MPIGLIAGNGTFPFLVLRAARRLGHDVTIVVAIEGEASPALDGARRAKPAATTVTWIALGQLGKCIATFTSAGVTRAVMAGQVKHVKLFGGVMPDLTLLLRCCGASTSKNTDALIAAVAGVLEENGHHAHGLHGAAGRSPRANPGVLSEAVSLSDSMRADFDVRLSRSGCAWPVSTSARPIVVKDRAVVAVEAMEGTDAVIARAAALAGPGTRVVKVAKPGQDMRFDVPVVGVATIRAMQAAKADALSVDAGKTLFIEGDAVVAAANEAGIVIVGRLR